LALLLVGGAVWLFLAAIPVFADGGPHNMVSNGGTGATSLTADGCAGCHRAHTSKDVTGMLLTGPGTGINPFCLSCHGATGTGAATNVENGVQYSLAGDGTRGGTIIGALRGGGFVTARIGSSSMSRNIAEPGGETKNAYIPVVATDQPVTSAHLAIGSSGVVTQNIVWGNGNVSANPYAGPTLSPTMVCTSCHNPHGNGNYRILQTKPCAAAPESDGSCADMTTGSLVRLDPAGKSRPSNNTNGAQDTWYATSTWVPVVGVNVHDSTTYTSAPHNQKNYTVIEKAPTMNSTTYPIDVTALRNSGAFLLYTDQLGAYTGSDRYGDYLHKFMSYDANEAQTGGTIANLYDGPNGYPNQGGFLGTSRKSDFPEDTGGTSIPAGAAGYDGFGYQMTLWCTQCHTRYLGWSSSRSVTSGDGLYMFRHSTSKYRFCLTCHVAHGTDSLVNADSSKGTTFSANVPYPNETALDHSTGGSGVHNSRLLKVDQRGICEACHDPTGTAKDLQGPAPTFVP
jgi:predicted CXXCH cytochrome family protein